MSSTVYIQGMANINRKLNEFEDKLAKRTLKKSLTEVSRPVITTIKANIRAKIKRRSGKLLRSIGAWFFKETGNNTIFVGPKTGKRAKYDAWYAHFLEFGTSGFGARKRNWGRNLITLDSGFTLSRKTSKTVGYSRRGGGIQARPFMRPAWDSHKNTIMEDLRRNLKTKLGL